jgi:hypothetical protein
MRPIANSPWPSVSAPFGPTMRHGEAVAALALLLAIIVSLQALAGAYTSGFGGYPDEPAHLVTSLMVRDFIASFDLRHPVQFAQQYYYHYPKVAIGVWPPVLYGALGVWFLIAGASRISALIFIAGIAATTASLVYLVGKRLIARWAGIFAAVLFVASPLVQESSSRVMAEHLVTLGMLVSTLCFARFARTGKIGDGLAFGTVAAVTILTHGNGWALGLVPGVTIALANRWHLLRRPGLWLAAVPVLAFCVPWYVFAPSIVGGRTGGVTSLVIEGLSGYPRVIYGAVGLPIVIVATVGVWATVIWVRPRSEVAPDWAALAALAIAIFTLHCILPVPVDSRYMVLLLPSVVLFAAAGVNYIGGGLGSRLPVEVVRLGVALTLIAAFFLGCFSLPLQLQNGGYGRLVRDAMARVSHVPQIWLVSSGSTGEGAMVAAVALEESRPGSYILRGKTILAGGDWFWQNTQDRYDTQAKLGQLLDQMHVTLIVVDDSVPPAEQRSYQQRLQKLVADQNEPWELIGSYPQTVGGNKLPNSLHVYAHRPVAALAAASPVLPLERLKSLMLRKELQ